ncbi:unnamed protein product [Phaedon cochleariae]|uniref:DUF4806 domain-containing protein n=1 Tax=Phaedon cochleariae TaxID=80249 RepID=A0A9N9SJ48_PHACE|nr:unnamed protein product [Phaedon cochleariae]
MVEDKNLKQIVSQNHVMRGIASEVLGAIHVFKNMLMNYTIQPREKENTSMFIRYPTLNFPMDTVDEMEKFDYIMANENDSSESIDELSKYGGTICYNFVKRILTISITNNLARQYSFYGRKGKRSFHLSSLSKIVVRAAEKAGVSKNYKEAESAVQSWLKRSVERLNAKDNKRQ